MRALSMNATNHQHASTLDFHSRFDASDRAARWPESLSAQDGQTLLPKMRIGIEKPVESLFAVTTSLFVTMTPM